MIAKYKKKKIQERIREQGDNFQSAIFGVIIILLIFGAMGFFLFSNVNLKQKREELNVKLESLQQELQDLEKQNEELKSGINNAGTESAQKEKLYEQGYVDQGAQQVVVLPSEEQKKEEILEQKTFWQKLMEKLKFKK